MKTEVYVLYLELYCLLIIQICYRLPYKLIQRIAEYLILEVSEVFHQ